MVSGIGPAELLIVAIIALVLFGAPVIAFVLGYTLGKRQSEPVPPPSEPARSGETTDDRS